MRSRITGVVGTVLVLVAAAVGSHFPLTSSKVVAAAPIPSTTDGVAGGERTGSQVAAQGRVEPVSEKLELAIGVVGQLAKVYVDEGDTIKRGQLLAELVNDDQKARVAEADAQVGLRKAELEKLLNGARQEERRQAAAQYSKTQASLALARLQVVRQRHLAANGFASQEALDQAVSTFGMTGADGDASKAALELINAPPRPEDVAIARANLALAEGNLSEQRALLEKTELRSPIDGVVLQRYMKSGETVSIQPLLPIVQIGDTRRLRVRAEIDETDVGRLELRQRAWLTASAYPRHRFGGVLSRIGQRMGRKTVRSDEPTEKSDTNILDVLIDLDDPGVRLPSGLRVNVFIEPQSVAKN